MADITQNVNYEITADDKTGPATDSSLANLIRQEKAAKEANQKAQKEAKDTKGVFGAITQALSGNFEALGVEIAKTGAKMSGLKMSGMALGAVGLAVSAVVSLTKAMADAFKSAGENLQSIKDGNLESTIKTWDDGAKAFNAEMERSRKIADNQRKAFEDNVQVIRQMSAAQNEFAKQQELALTKTQEDRERIERKYRYADAENGAYLDQQLRDREKIDARDEVARVRQELAQARENLSFSRRLQKEASSRQAAGTRQGIWGSVKALFGSTDYEDENARNAEQAKAAYERVQEDVKRVKELEASLENANHRLKMANVKDEIAISEAAAADQKDLNEEWRKIDEANAARAEVEAKASAERVEAARRQAQDATQKKRLKDIADAEAAEKIAATEAAEARTRLAAAQAQVQRAWGWYRDKGSMAAQLTEEKANADAERQYEKDFQKLKSWRPDWETAKNLSVDQEAVRRVALARREEDAAQKAVASIDAKMDSVVAHLAKLTEEEG